MARIRHQHAITAGKAEIGGEGGTLVATLFLHNLNQQDLAALDHVLDLITAAQRHALSADFVGFLGLATALPLTATAPATAAIFATFGFRCFFAFVVKGVVDLAVLDGRDLVLFVGVDLGHAVIVIAVERFVAGSCQIVSQGFAQFVVANEVFLTLGDGTQGGLFLGMGGFFRQQSLAVLLGDLVIIRMDFAEGKEAMAIAAKIDERRLQRRFNPGYFGKIDITLDLLVFSRFKVEFLNPVALEHRHPGFFLVARID